VAVSKVGGLLAKLIMAGVLGLGAAACSSEPSGPSAAAKGLCGSVIATVPPDSAIAINVKTVEAGEDSGYPSLNRAAIAMVRALHDHSSAEGSAAESAVAKACEKLGITLGTFNP